MKTDKKANQSLVGLWMITIILAIGIMASIIVIDVERNANKELREKVIHLEVENYQLSKLICGDKTSFMSRVNEITKQKSYQLSSGWITENELNNLCSN